MRGSAVSGQNGTRGRALRAVLPASDMRGWARAPLPRALRRARRPRPSHQGQKWGHAGETGPCGSSPRAFERTADPKLAKVCAITHALELDSRLRLENTRQIVCALRALPSPWILKRILLAIFNIRTGAKGAGACRGTLSGRISSESGARGWLGASVRACFVKSNRAKGDPSTCGDARDARNGCAAGIPADARQYAAPIPIHPSRRMRCRHASAKTKEWARFIISRRNKASACGKTIATVPFRHPEPRGQSEAGMRTHSARATG